MQSKEVNYRLPRVSPDILVRLRVLSHKELFAAAIGKPQGSELAHSDLDLVHKEYLNIIEEASKAYQQSIVEHVLKKKYEIDEKLSEIQATASKAINELCIKHKLDQNSSSEISGILGLVLFQLKHEFEWVINRWLKFYTREFWVMVELGIDQFSVMDRYLVSKLVDEIHAEFSENKYVLELIIRFASTITEPVD